MAVVSLTQGQFALVDDADLATISAYRWRYQRRYDGRGGYATTHVRGADGIKRQMGMHRLLLAPPSHLQVDHINGDGLDNRRANIRICTSAQNAANRPSRKAIKGICQRGAGRYLAVIYSTPGRYEFGPFETEHEAGRAYDAACRILHGEFGRLNFPALEPVELSSGRYHSYTRSSPHPDLVGVCVVMKTAGEKYAEWRAEYVARVADEKRKLAEQKRFVAAAKRKLIALVGERDADILARFSAGEKCTSIAAEHKISKQRVHQLFKTKAPLVGLTRMAA